MGGDALCENDSFPTSSNFVRTRLFSLLVLLGMLCKLGVLVNLEVFCLSFYYYI